MIRFFLLSLLALTSLRADQLTLEASLVFLKSLTDKQRRQVIFPADHPNRWSMRYTGGGDRPGLTIDSLQKNQRTAVDALIAKVLSKQGLAKLDEIQKQDGDFDLGRMVIAFFGDPRSDESFAWRIGEHHFTVVHVEEKNGELLEFGPVLLGANPFGPWDKEEQNFINLYQECKDQVKVIDEKGIASEGLKNGHGVLISTLKKRPQIMAKALWNHRLQLFTPAISKALNKAVAKAGGWPSLRIAFFNEEPKKLGKDGGRWDAKIGNETVLFDIETSRGHNHMSIWIKAR